LNYYKYDRDNDVPTYGRSPVDRAFNSMASNWVRDWDEVTREAIERVISPPLYIPQEICKKLIIEPKQKETKMDKNDIYNVSLNTRENGWELTFNSRSRGCGGNTFVFETTAKMCEFLKKRLPQPKEDK